MLPPLVLLIIFLIFCPSGATEIKKPDLQKVYVDAVKFAQKLKKNSLTSNTLKNPIKKPSIGVCRKTVKNDFISEIRDTKETKILIFVSFSMPKVSLENLLKQAKSHNAILITRGLKDNSFKATAEFLKTVHDYNISQGIEINPELFEIYEIKKVPVFILVKDNKQINRLSGNVTLEFAARKLSEEL